MRSFRKVITDSETDFLFVSDLLTKKQPFLDQFAAIVGRHNIPFERLPYTKDIWCVDYMPVQTDANRFVQFRYNPGYLQGKKWAPTMTDPSIVVKSLKLTPVTCDLVVDGGNVIKGRNWVILTDKIFLDNPTHDPKAILKRLEVILEAKPIIIPRAPYDFTGHADGMVRWYDETTVLINQYRKADKPAFQQKLKSILYREGLRTIEVPYNPYPNRSYDSARGIYINYLQMNGNVILPVFDLAEDDRAVRIFEELFPGISLETINANQIAEDGGVLNCVTWNIQR